MLRTFQPPGTIQSVDVELSLPQVAHRVGLAFNSTALSQGNDVNFQPFFMGNIANAAAVDRAMIVFGRLNLLDA